jgi:DNA-binding response OmpR family regulator
VLVVEDDADIAGVLRRSLDKEGYDVRVAGDGEAALEQSGVFEPDAVVLDLGLPKLDGMEVARRMRAGGDVPILMLTARDALDARVEGLDSGADDYLVKPFDFEELVARIHAVARRRLSPEAGILRAGPITLDQERHLVTLDGSAVELTVKEYDLLCLFLRHVGRVLSRRFILDQVWGHEFYDENNVEVYVRYLRRKLDDPEHQRIETVRGVGYRLRG